MEGDPMNSVLPVQELVCQEGPVLSIDGALTRFLGCKGILLISDY